MADLRIVMFPHPAVEYSVPGGHRIAKGVHCGWNTGHHRRRLLISEGEYVAANGKISSGTMTFWSEWEADTQVWPLPPGAGCPPNAKFVHRPVPPTQAPKNGAGECCANTDPCVFGDTFKYSICRQTMRNNTKGRLPTKMQELADGSLILFGGTINHSWYLDTAFVVGASQKYEGPGSHIMCGATYRALTLNQTSGDLTFYRGKGWGHDSGGLYSFTPARLVSLNGDEASLGKDNRERFKLDVNALNRLIPQRQNFVNPNNTRIAKTVIADDATVRKVWNEILRQMKVKDFVPAVHFDYPGGNSRHGIRRGALSGALSAK